MSAVKHSDLVTEAIKTLQERALWYRLFPNSKYYVETALTQLVKDCRRSPKVARALEDAGLVTVEEDGRKDRSDIRGTVLRSTDRLFEEIEPEALDLLSTWGDAKAKSKDEGSIPERKAKMPFIYVGDLSTGQFKWVLDNTAVDWYVIDQTPIQYVQSWSDAPNTEDSNWFGPLSQQEAMDKRVEINDNRTSYTFAVSSVALRKHVKECDFRERFEHACTVNLSWGLERLAILTEEEANLIISADLGGGMRISSGSANLGTDPDKWCENSEKVFDCAKKQIEALQQRCAILTHMWTCINKMGGWNKFLEEYRRVLRAEMEEQEVE